jgi:phage baseplate assembly protein W
MREPDKEKAFLGVGWAFPVCLESDGVIATATYEEDIHQAIRIILGTNHGERVMRPDFGAGLNRFVFEPVNLPTMLLVKKRVEEALIDWEPRIDVLNVKVTADPSERNKLLIDVEYRVRATNTAANLVYPFYLQEGAPK